MRRADHPDTIPWLSGLAVAGSTLVAYSAVTAIVVYFSLKLQHKFNTASQQDKEVKPPKQLKQVKWAETKEVREFDKFETPNIEGPSNFQPVLTEPQKKEVKPAYNLCSPEDKHSFLERRFADINGKLWSASSDPSSK